MTRSARIAKKNLTAPAVVSLITTENLGPLAWAKGYRGVSGLAKVIGRSRVTLHRAVKWPDQYGPTIALLREKLL